MSIVGSEGAVGEGKNEEEEEGGAEDKREEGKGG